MAGRNTLHRHPEGPAGARRDPSRSLCFDYIAREIATQIPSLARARIIIAHLGVGANLGVLQDGRSIATTMGFSALDGLVMATRCGSLHPGVILHLGQQGRSIAEIQEMLYHNSGLLGVSGIRGDMRVLLAGAPGGLDGLVFAAGIGEHAPSIRAAICDRLAWLGLGLNGTANAGGAGRISAPGSRLEVHTVPTDEEAMIARHTRATLQQVAA